MSEEFYGFDDEDFDDSDMDADLSEFNCGYVPDQGCMLAGTEECDWECSFRPEIEREIERETSQETVKEPRRQTEFVEIAQSELGEANRFNFVCEGCQAEGDLRVPLKEGMTPFGCPEGCGATYIMWNDPGKGPSLMCVVCPVSE